MEKCVLGCILLDPSCLLRIAPTLAKDDFYAEPHRTIYAAMLDLLARHVPIDLVTVTSHLQDAGAIEAAGGVGAIAELTEFVPTASHVDEYAAIVASKAYQRRLIHFAYDVQMLAYKADADPSEVRERAEKMLLDMSRGGKSGGMHTLSEILNETYEAMAAAADSADPTSRFVFTGFRDLDNLLGGMEPSDLVILAARPSIGKTALALTIAQRVAEGGKSVGIFSLEMGRQQLARRLLSAEARIDGWKLRANKLSEIEHGEIATAMSTLRDLPLSIFDSSGVSLMELRSQARRMKMERGLDLLVVDYIQLMTSANARDGRTAEVSEISRGMKILARELDVPILCLSQLSRAVETRDSKIPNLSDLRESGSIEQDADTVIFLYRDDYYDPMSTRPGEVDLHLKKNRNGPTGRVTLRFDNKTTSFRDLDALPAPAPSTLPFAA